MGQTLSLHETRRRRRDAQSKPSPLRHRNITVASRFAATGSLRCVQVQRTLRTLSQSIDAFERNLEIMNRAIAVMFLTLAASAAVASPSQNDRGAPSEKAIGGSTATTRDVLVRLV